MKCPTGWDKEPIAIRWLVCAALLSSVSAAFAEETAGEKFRKALAQIDENCRLKKVGPYLDPADPEYRRKQGNTSCDILTLQPRDWRSVKMVKLDSQPYPVPEHWLATAEGRFAHSIKLPAKGDQQWARYTPGMSASQYFDELCRTEAGEFVLRRVEGVAAVFEARPRGKVAPESFAHLFVLEDPYGYHHGESAEKIGAAWTGESRYRAIERRDQRGAGFEQFFRRTIRDSSVETTRSASPMAAYGFVWRGIVRPNDRELGIAGGELIAYAIGTNEILGYRRGFARTAVGAHGVGWEFTSVCPKYEFRGGRSKDFDFGLWFLSDVLRPVGVAEYRAEISQKP